MGSAFEADTVDILLDEDKVSASAQIAGQETRAMMVRSGQFDRGPYRSETVITGNVAVFSPRFHRSYILHTYDWRHSGALRRRRQVEADCVALDESGTQAKVVSKTFLDRVPIMKICNVKGVPTALSLV